jgi:disulfide bond formation protein DsbB
MIKTYLNHISLGAISLSMILFVLISEYVFGFAPCSLCLIQRYPHMLIAITSIWLIFFRTHNFFLYPVNTLVMALSIILASYHVGVEQSIFQGPQSCSSSNLSLVSEKSAEALLNEILNTSVVRCNEVTWTFIGLSMATWNLILSGALFIGWTVSSLHFLRFFQSKSFSK